METRRVRWRQPIRTVSAYTQPGIITGELNKTKINHSLIYRLNSEPGQTR
jgi:hypothetical protein